MDTSDDPITAVAVGASVFGTLSSAANQRRQGREAQKLANQRAAVDLADAEAVEKQTREAARLELERGRKLLKSQKAGFAAGNVRVDVGSPLVVAAQTRADIARDVGYIFERGTTQASRFRQSAKFERKYGKTLRTQAKWAAVSTLFQGFGSLGFRAKDAGFFKKKETVLGEGLNP